MTLPLLLSHLVTADICVQIEPGQSDQAFALRPACVILPFFEPFFEPLDKGNILRCRSIRRGLHPGRKLLDIRG
jgi:hypothetical protein